MGILGLFGYLLSYVLSSGRIQITYQEELFLSVREADNLDRLWLLLWCEIQLSRPIKSLIMIKYFYHNETQ